MYNRLVALAFVMLFAEGSFASEVSCVKWQFKKGAISNAAASFHTSNEWQNVRLPHDWSANGVFSPAGDPETAKLPWRGEAWYRYEFFCDARNSGKNVFFDFDGVMANPAVFINGQKAGQWDYGYCPFRVDASPFVRLGQTNSISVHVNTRNIKSRWYPGAGIIRPVRMVVSDPVHIAWNGIWIRTTRLDEKKAGISVQVNVENTTTNKSRVKVQLALFDPEGKAVDDSSERLTLQQKGTESASFDFSISKPQRWDIETPRLYRAVATVLRDGKPVDEQTTTFGLRTAQFDASKGFLLNGRRVQIKGVCLHHDHGPLGAASNRRAMERQLELLKEMGCNAIRTSHNIPASDVLDLCDRMGFLVYNEAFDKWSTDPGFLDFARRQLRNFVLRDRNHPSVILWGAGNEIDQQRSSAFNSLAAPIKAAFKELDPDRPVAMAVSNMEMGKGGELDDPFDVGAYNYRRRYIMAHERRPTRPVLASETASTISTRGHYDWPHNMRLPTRELQLSSFDRMAVPWGNLPDQEFAWLEQYPYAAGEFVWSGFDYLGEPTPYGAGMAYSGRITMQQAARSSFFGIFDLCGFPKDRYYLYRSHWVPEKPAVHVLPHWNWEGREGQPIPVYVYTSGDSAELFVNGKSMGRKAKAGPAGDVFDRYRLRWETVPYEPGELRAVAYKGGAVLGEDAIKTAGAPAQLRLTPDRTAMAATGDDLIYVTVDALDARGVFCPNATNQVRFEVKGNAGIAAVCNGDPHSYEPFVSDRMSLFHGKALLILRSGADGVGEAEVRAKADGLQVGTVNVQIRMPDAAKP